jgi:hypothetical protein
MEAKLKRFDQWYFYMFDYNSARSMLGQKKKSGGLLGTATAYEISVPDCTLFLSILTL